MLAKQGPQRNVFGITENSRRGHDGHLVIGPDVVRRHAITIDSALSLRLEPVFRALRDTNLAGYFQLIVVPDETAGDSRGFHIGVADKRILIDTVTVNRRLHERAGDRVHHAADQVTAAPRHLNA